MTRKSFLLVGIALLSMLGCTGAPITRDEIIGEWRIEENTRRDLPERFRSIDISLLLDADGQFVARQLPGPILFGLPPEDALLVDGRGVWSLGEDQGRQVLLLEFLEFQPKGVKGTHYTLNVIYMYRIDDQPRLYFYTYDMDDGRRVHLKKTMTVAWRPTVTCCGGFPQLSEGRQITLREESEKY